MTDTFQTQGKTAQTAEDISEKIEEAKDTSDLPSLLTEENAALESEAGVSNEVSKSDLITLEEFMTSLGEMDDAQ